jgi:DNA mismatch endonuclease (patch repair protein)
MADVVDRATRSRMMSGIKGRNTVPELLVRRYLHRRGFRYRLHDGRLPGRPDLVLPRYSAVVEVRGCFWHRHNHCQYSYTPKSNLKFWKRKFAENVRRDRRNEKALRADGWRVFTVWECEVARRPVLERLVRNLMKGKG